MARTTTLYLLNPADENDPLKQLLDSNSGGSMMDFSPPASSDMGGPRQGDPQQTLIADEPPGGPNDSTPQNSGPLAANDNSPLMQLRQPMTLADLGGFAQPAPQPQPTQDDRQTQMLAALQQNRDPELDALYKAREKQALENSQPKAYGGGEFLRDAAGPLAALLLDATVNHGRGAGGIVNAAAQGAAQQRAIDEKAAQDEAEIAIRLHGKQVDPLSQQIALMNAFTHQQTAQTGATNAATGQARQQGTEAWRQQQSDINSPWAQTQIGLAGGRADAGTRARVAAQTDLNPQMAQNAANIRGAQTQAQIDATLQNAPATAAAAANQAAGVETAKVGANRAAQAANRPLPAGYVEADQALFANANEDPNARGKMLADTMIGRQLADASQGIADMRAQNGPQWLPGQNSGEYKALHLAVVGAANRVIADAGTLNQGERELMSRLVPDAEPNWKDFAGWMAGADLTAQQLEGFAKGLQAVINSRVASYGLRYDPNAATGGGSGMGAPPPQSLPAQANIPQAGSQVPGAPPGIGRSAAANANAPLIHHVRKSDGSVIETQFTPQQMQGRLPRGWTVVD